MIAVLICLALSLAATSAVFLALLLSAGRQLDDTEAEAAALREQLTAERTQAIRLRERLIAVTRERDQLADDAHLHATWTISDGGAAWAA